MGRVPHQRATGGAVPAHAWVPDVADGAPAPAAAFLTVAPKVGALVALGRLACVLRPGAGPSYFEPLGAPIPVLGRWAKTAAVGCGVAVVALGILAEGPLGGLRVAHLLPG